jgi:hypothetical protein
VEVDNMDAMSEQPERVWVDLRSKHEAPKVVTSYFCYEEQPLWDDCPVYIPAARLAEVEAQRDALVEAAYREGWYDGHHQGIGCGHDLAPRCREATEMNEDWLQSETKRAALAERGTT